MKKLTKRNGGGNLAQVLKRFAPWVRRSLRAVQLILRKKPSKLHRCLKPLKYKPPFKLIKMSSWRKSASLLASYAMPNEWFKAMSLYQIDEVKIGALASYY